MKFTYLTKINYHFIAIFKKLTIKNNLIVTSSRNYNVLTCCIVTETVITVF